MGLNMGGNEITIQSAVKLSGTLTQPKSNVAFAPAVCIIPGTGKLDRDGKLNSKINLRLYKQLADALTEMGFYTLRYDKRGVGKSEGDFLRTGMWDLVDDAQAAVRFLKNVPGVNPQEIIVLGHSEGSTLGTALAAREELGGLILLSGAVERISEALVRQREIARVDILNAKGFQGTLLRLLGVPNKIEKQAQKYIDKVMKSNKDTLRISLVPTNAKWMREHFTYNVREDLQRVTCPVLAITGARDIQANPEVLKELSTYVKSDNEYHIIENMGHSCKFQEKTSNMLTVKKDIVEESKLPIHPDLTKTLERWLRDRYLKSNEQIINPA
ncbi:MULTISPECIES: alpha/beta hydrolase [unclassified Bacillus (in: firmicutes)]|uniref:alpha/beta hydrolase n=1 Tax=unclassified Bacillus (in: firmicutes) TaxID=185979 RepID=UPI0008E5A261|nr:MULTISPECIES: alpha/beta fold hydrolase [unclassified Bacillus (in: firmicutes)]SFA90980.1 hypothetical protein SAMN02799634_102528 [Bacillus sp. UNCCL13]SFQ85454.1 hypothetical protein SAMN04488577_2648 [Bacillus sp. cl95]